MDITAIGHSQLVTPSASYKLNTVLHVPALQKNLLSIRQFCRENNCVVEFSDTGFCLKDRKTHKMLFLPVSNGPLYPISPSAATVGLVSPQLSLIASRQDPLLWHRRLAHSNPHVLSFLFHNNIVNSTSNSVSSFHCRACELGKHHKLSIGYSSSQTNVPFALIHSDVWQSPIPSNSGFRYYVLFIDDFTRYSWLFPLRYKSEGNFLLFTITCARNLIPLF